MPSNLFSPRVETGRTAAEIQADQEAAMNEDSRRLRASHSAGRDRRSIGVTRQPRS